MTLSWKELVLHGLLKKVGEPSLANEILKMVMKGRFPFLEEEAREFHSRNIEPVLKWIRLRRMWDKGEWVHGSQIKEAQNGCASPIHTKATDELLSSWRKRVPEQRRRAVMMNKESKLLRWRGHSNYDITSGIARDIDDDYHSIENSIKWYGEIHEGRYYLFWDKKIGNAVTDVAARRKQQRSFLMSGFDINIIDGEGLYSRISDTWVYEYEQWIKNRGSWGKRQSEFTMVHGIGKKEKKHIDDMFLKE